MKLALILFIFIALETYLILKIMRIYQRKKEIMRTGSKIIGVIINNKEHKSNDGDILYNPIIRFEHNSKTIEKEISANLYYKEKIGKTFLCFYNPSISEEVIVCSFLYLYGEIIPYIFAFFVAASFFIFGLFNGFNTGNSTVIDP